MPVVWTTEKLLALEPVRLDIVRRNAQREGNIDLVQAIEAIQASRKARPSIRNESPVVGFHFKCEDDYEVTLTPTGDFWSGVWVVDEELCEPAREASGYVALHSAKRELSYRQGTILDWKSEPRTKGKTPTGISFLLRPFPDRLTWFGTGTGEKGYRRLDDEPRWVPRR